MAGRQTHDTHADLRRTLHSEVHERQCNTEAERKKRGAGEREREREIESMEETREDVGFNLN